MTYCLSDLHGCYRQYRKMLQKIGFGERDTLYILGDAVDRGDHGVEILLDIAARKNAVFLRGNHDVTAAAILQWWDTPLPPKTDIKALKKGCVLWLSDGGEPTLSGFLRLNTADRKTVLNLIRRAPYFAELSVAGRRYHLSHTLPEYEIWQKGSRNADFILGEPDYEIPYDPRKFFVTGHTPTGLIDPAGKGRILKMNRHIAIDCGAAFGNPLGCICLETGEEFYV